MARFFGGLMMLLALAGVLLPNGADAAQEVRKETRKFAVFAGGCFWSVELAFDKVRGVLSTTSGYAGGKEKNPTYEDVSNGLTGHYEAVRVEYDPARVSYQTLLDVFWRTIDPLDDQGQFCDKGAQYRTAIFVGDEDEKKLAQISKNNLQKSGKLKGDIVTEILPVTAFFAAEAYHQDFHRKNPARYQSYRWGCGRDARLKQIWDEKETRSN